MVNPVASFFGQQAGGANMGELGNTGDSGAFAEMFASLSAGTGSQTQAGDAVSDGQAANLDAMLAAMIAQMAGVAGVNNPVTVTSENGADMSIIASVANKSADSAAQTATFANAALVSEVADDGTVIQMSATVEEMGSKPAGANAAFGDTDIAANTNAAASASSTADNLPAGSSLRNGIPVSVLTAQPLADDNGQQIALTAQQNQTTQSEQKQTKQAEQSRTAGPVRDSAVSLFAGSHLRASVAQSQVKQDNVPHLFTLLNNNAAAEHSLEDITTSADSGQEDSLQTLVGQGLSESTVKNNTAAIRQTPETIDQELHTKVIDQVVKEVKLHRLDDRSDIVVKLTPPELGTLKIHLTQDAQGMTSQITAGSEQVRGLLQAHLPALVDALNNAGIRMDSVNITAGSSFNSMLNDSAQPDSGRPGSHHQHRSSRSGRSAGDTVMVGAAAGSYAAREQAGFSWLA